MKSPPYLIKGDALKMFFGNANAHKISNKGFKCKMQMHAHDFKNKKFNHKS